MKRSLCRDYYLLGRLHVVKNGLIGFFKAYGDIGIRDIFLSFTEPKQVDKILTCAHGYIKFDEELVLDLVLSFLQQSEAFARREAVRLGSLSAPSEAERQLLAVLSSPEEPLEAKLASLARGNATYAVWHDALLVDALPLLAFRRAGEWHVNDPDSSAGETLDRAALKAIAPLFPTTGQYNYTVAILQLLRTVLTMPEHICGLYTKNFVLPSRRGEFMWHDDGIEKQNAWTQTFTHRVTTENVTGQMNEDPVVQAAYEGLLRGIGLPAEGSAWDFARVRRAFGSHVQARQSMGALFRHCIFDRFHDDLVRESPRNLFREGTPALNPKVSERRQIGRMRLEEVAQQAVLNAQLGGRYSVPPVSKRYGAICVLQRPPAQLSQQVAQRRLRKAHAALFDLLEGKTIKGPHCWAEWQPEVQRFVMRHGNKAAMRDYVNREFGGVGWRLMQLEGEMRIAQGACELRVTDLLIDFLMMGRRLLVRNAKAIQTPEQLIVATCQALRPTLERVGAEGRIHLHADQAIKGSIEKGVTVQGRIKARAGGTPARLVLQKGRALPPAVQRVPTMFSKLMDNRGARQQLFRLFPGALDAASVVSSVLPHADSQELHFLGFHEQASTEWRVGKGAAALQMSRRMEHAVGIEPMRIEHLEADTSLFYSAMQRARAGQVAIVRMEDTDGVWIGPLVWALTRWWQHLADGDITGEIFIWVAAQYKTEDGEKWQQSVHGGTKEWVKEELVSVRERVQGITRHAALKHLPPLQAVATMVYACIFCGGDTTAFFKGRPHSRCFELLLRHLPVIGPIVSDVTEATLRGQRVPTAEGVPAALERFVMVLYVAGGTTANGRGTNWPKFGARMTPREEEDFLRGVTMPQIWKTLLPECAPPAVTAPRLLPCTPPARPRPRLRLPRPRYIADLSQLPPSADELAKKIGRTDYRFAHWLRAVLPTIDLRDVPPSGFKPLPGTGDVLATDGSNVAFDWGAPEPLAQHLPKEVASLRSKGRAGGRKGAAEEQPRCRAIVGPKREKHRCRNAIHEKAGIEDGWLAGTCGSHKQNAVLQLRCGECWSAEAEVAEEAAAAAVAASAAAAAEPQHGGVEPDLPRGDDGDDAVAALALLAAAGFHADDEEDGEDEHDGDADEHDDAPDA